MLSGKFGSMFSSNEKSRLDEEKIATLVRFAKNDLLKSPYVDTKKFTPEEIEEAKRRYAEIKKTEAANPPTMMDSISSLLFNTKPQVVKKPEVKQKNTGDEACACRLF